ncbi:thiol:disulfide interchange protein precursor [bacterium BMS3Abin15]|nr:thiol:disulfide interchange protein precursor [bacterium BMS3Abin15]
MKKILFILLIFIALPIIVSSQEKKQAAYFYADWCPHCQQVDKFFTEKGFYDKYDVKKFNIDGGENKKLLAQVYLDNGYKKYKGIPVIIIDDKLIAGDVNIINSFEEEIEKSRGTVLSIIEKARGNIGGATTNNISLTVLVGAALVDAINPCAFAVLIILIATVISARGRNQALATGLLFAAAVFVSYFLMGLGLYKVVTVFSLPKIISIVVGVLAVLIGLANLKDAFWHGKVFLMEVPMSWRPKMKSILKGVTSPPGAIIAGFLVSLFLLPCTSGPYIVILGLLAEKVELAKTIPLLFLYNFIFVLPMILITLAMYFGLRAGKLEEWRMKNIRLLHAVGGTIMLIIGIYLINTWI